ncbi:YbaY family lipoprotein [Streptomyces endophytica]|uniref:YbaY family lipoprotein n=1 Tax=Streptomyces endophytica TaxID=2991496 RepID=A0ABY6PGX2_9ACTN|nr:YbaY family lipoprotein [Streptomyces endophytica]UZJ33133.1 YbaY family lipoprotein [Streptomyces endophytica]
MNGTVRGLVALPADTPVTRAARVLVEVRDVSLADAPSTVVAAQVQTDVPLAPHGRVPFRVDVPDLDPKGAYGLRVHVDVSGSGSLEVGDLITTQATVVRPRSDEELMAPVTTV